MAQGARARATRKQDDEEAPAQRAPVRQRWAIRKIGRGRYNYRQKMFEPGKVYMVPKEVHDHLTDIADGYGRPKYFVSVPVDADGNPIQRQVARRGATIHRRGGPGTGSRIRNRQAAAQERGDPVGAEGFLEPDDGGDGPGVPV